MLVAVIAPIRKSCIFKRKRNFPLIIKYHFMLTACALQYKGSVAMVLKNEVCSRFGSFPESCLTTMLCQLGENHHFAVCENKGTDLIRINCETDQRLCSRYMDSTFSLLSKSKISSL